MLPVVSFAGVSQSDFEVLADIRVAAMRESLERVGRFDPIRARERLWSTFRPEHTRWIIFEGTKVGFCAVRPASEGVHLDHLYIHPNYQSRGIGSVVLTSIVSDVEKQGVSIFVSALKESASNRFYLRYGFLLRSEGDWDNHYIRVAATALKNKVEK